MTTLALFKTVFCEGNKNSHDVWFCIVVSNIFEIYSRLRTLHRDAPRLVEVVTDDNYILSTPLQLEDIMGADDIDI